MRSSAVLLFHPIWTVCWTAEYLFRVLPLSKVLPGLFIWHLSKHPTLISFQAFSALHHSTFIKEKPFGMERKLLLLAGNLGKAWKSSLTLYYMCWNLARNKTFIFLLCSLCSKTGRHWQPSHSTFYKMSFPVLELFIKSESLGGIKDLQTLWCSLKHFWMLHTSHITQNFYTKVSCLSSNCGHLRLLRNKHFNCFDSFCCRDCLNKTIHVICAA